MAEIEKILTELVARIPLFGKSAQKAIVNAAEQIEQQQVAERIALKDEIIQWAQRYDKIFQRLQQEFERGRQEGYLEGCQQQLGIPRVDTRGLPTN